MSEAVGVPWKSGVEVGWRYPGKKHGRELGSAFRGMLGSVLSGESLGRPSAVIETSFSCLKDG